MAMVLSNIGIVPQGAEGISAGDWLLPGSKTTVSAAKPQIRNGIYDANLGSVYMMLERYDSALFYSLRANEAF